MPELPEVETVRRGLSQQLSRQPRLLELKRSSKKLRFEFPASVFKQLKGRPLQSVERRAKYLLFDFGDKILINHLGMTGSWRPVKTPKLELHDHVILRFENGLNLVFRDPRRFGYFDLLDKDGWDQSGWFRHLGPEPLDSKAFSPEYLFAASRSKKAPIKNLIMDQKVVVGVGNIYASEALFLAGIQPLRPAGRLSLEDCRKLVAAIQKVLKASIKRGGTTIRDFVSSKGDLGYFVQSLKVYDRSGENCKRCRTPISVTRLAGRSTYWCPECQK